MEFRKVLALRGPNIWSNSPVLEAWVDLGPLDRPSTDFPGFNDRLMTWLPSMIEHRCSIGERGGFFQRLRQGTYPGHILEHVTLELHTLVGVDVGFGRARETSEAGVYRVVVAYVEETLGRQCLAVGRELVLAAIHDLPFDLKGELHKLRESGRRGPLGPEHGRHRRCRAAPRHPGAASEHCQPRPVGPRLAAAADPGGRDRSHQRHRRRNRARQRTDPDAPGRRRRPHSRGTIRRQRRRGLGCRDQHRRARRRQTAGRQPGTRSGDEPRHAGASDGRLPRRAGREQQRAGDRREVRRGPRLPAAGRSRSRRGRRPPRARQGPWRRRPHHPGIDRHRQHGSPPGRPSRHRSEQDEAGRRVPGGAGRSGLHPRVRPRGRRRPC